MEEKRSSPAPGRFLEAESYRAPSVQDPVCGEAEAYLYGLIRPGQKYELETMRHAGLPAPFVCEQGVCGTCMARRVKGEVALRENHVLSDSDLASGYTLACQGVPCSEVCEIEIEG